MTMLDTHTTLDEWLEEEAAQVARNEQGLGPGLADPQVVAGLDGLTLLQRMLAGEIPTAPMTATLDDVLMSVGPGEAVFQGTPRAEFCNPLGTVHGGWFATLLDSALGCAVHTTVPAGRGYATAELSVTMVRPLTAAVSRVRAVARLVNGGRTVASARAELVGPDGKLYAHASTTCIIVDLPTGG